MAYLGATPDWFRRYFGKFTDFAVDYGNEVAKDIIKKTPGLNTVYKMATRIRRVSRRGTGARRMKRYGRKSFKKFRSRNHDTPMLSKYTDQATLYKRKATKFGGKRRKAKTMKLMRSLMNLENPIQTHMSTQGVLSSSANQVAFKALPGIYSFSGTAPWTDLQKIITDSKTAMGAYASGTSGTPDLWAAAPKIGFKSAVLDVYFRNTSATAPCTVIIYECVCRFGQITEGTPDNLFLYTADYFTSNAGGPESATLIGASLFEMKPFCSSNIIKKVQEINLDVGASASLQIRDSRSKIFDTRRLPNFATENYGLAGWTQFYVFQIRGCVTNNAGNANLAAAEVSWFATRNYCYGILDSKPAIQTDHSN